MITLLSLFSQFPILHKLFIWDLELIKSGEVWRLVTSSFTHTNIYHMLMNLGALWFCLFAFGKEKATLTFVLICSFFVGFILCFIPFYNDMTYSGLSGLIHGLVVLLASNLKRNLFVIVLIGTISKVVFEIIYGTSISTSVLINAHIAAETHVIGVIVGVIFLLINKKDSE